MLLAYAIAPLLVYIYKCLVWLIFLRLFFFLTYNVECNSLCVFSFCSLFSSKINSLLNIDKDLIRLCTRDWTCIHATTLVSLNNSSAQSLNTLNLTWIRSKSKCRTYLVLVSLASCFQSFAYRFLSRMLFASSTLMMFTANVCGILFVFARHTYTATVCCCRSFSSVYNISTTYTVSNDRHIFE